MSFDQFQRYKTVQVIVEQLKERTGRQQVSILEIGGNGQCNLEELLPGEQIQYSNLTIPKERIGDERFIALDGTNMPQVATDAYDLVIALDVFEHVPGEKREQFLVETYRVAKYVTILCFPFANGKNESAERRVNNYYKAIYGKNHIWLEEHIKNGLPAMEETEDFLRNKGMDYHMFRHGDIIVWEEWMKALFDSYDIPGVSDYVRSLEEYYEQDLYRCDVGADNYRVFLMTAKDKELVCGLGQDMDRYFSESMDVGVRDQLFRGLADLKQLCARKACHKVESSLYVDCGNGYSEEGKLVQETLAGADGKVYLSCEYEVPENCVALRFDPEEGCGCILSGMKAVSDQGELSPVPVGGWEQNGMYVFAGTDPQIMLDIDGKKISRVKLEGILQLCPIDTTGLVLEFADRMVTDNLRKAEDAIREKEEAVSVRNEIAVEKEQALRDKVALETEKNSLQQRMEQQERELQEQLAETRAKAELYETAYNGIIHSKTWKLTKPFRKVFGKGES